VRACWVVWMFQQSATYFLQRRIYSFSISTSFLLLDFMPCACSTTTSLAHPIIRS
jgi:hypothetical protein